LSIPLCPRGLFLGKKYNHILRFNFKEIICFNLKNNGKNIRFDIFFDIFFIILPFKTVERSCPSTVRLDN
jgi:hypothetical protein